MSRKDGVLALLVVVVWGLNFVVIKVGLHNMPPLMLAGLRFMLVAFPAIFFVARPKVPLNLLLGYGLTISFAQFAFLFCAINFGMPAGLASLVLQAQAFFTIVLGAFTFGERLHGKQLAGIALAIFGVLGKKMICTPPSFSSMTATGPKHWKRRLRFSCRRLRLLKVTAADRKRCSGT